MNPALSIPWAMHWPKRVFAAYAGSRCSGFVSPLTSANRWTSSAVTVFSNSARSPTLTPSTASVIECSFYSSRGDHYRRIVRARQPPLGERLRPVPHDKLEPPCASMCAMNVGERLARFVVETQRVPEDAILQAKRAVLDTLGVALAGSCEQSARAVVDWLRDQGGRPEAALLGRALRLPAAAAALAHGTAAHALDFDDVSLPMRGHPSAPLLPALLAVGDVAGSSGRDILTAFVLGFEVEAKLGRAIGGAPHAPGWRAPPT